jgi:TetR/AcrR family transcriptional regulator, transcriptional repressor for nem operon
MSPAGRPREFDESEVLLRALGVFWLRGYEATSMSDLIEGTGLAKGSIYQAFGDKRQLFLASLKCYLETARKTVRNLLLSPFSANTAQTRRSRQREVRERLQQVFLGSIQSCELGHVKRGCFAVNCLSEMVPHDAEVKALIQHHFCEFERYLSLALARIDDADANEADAKGHITNAKLLQVLLTGLLVMSKGPLDSNSVQLIVERALDQLL